MARANGVGIHKRNAAARPVPTYPQERRLATPNPDLLVVKIGERHRKLRVEASPKERAAGVLARVAKVMAAPGVDRTRIFQSTSGKPVYAYFVSSEDPTKVVREDASGRQKVGRLIGGRFRPITADRAV
jgi:hypothetical protein